MQPLYFGNQLPAAYNVYVNPYGMRRLSPAFRPGTFDVLCARGKIAYDAEGNRRFRELVKQHQKSYSACTCKYQKSKIVSHIVNTVRHASPHGGFVKQIDGAWCEVGDRHAKEKVGQTFRDLLHNKYSSSTKAKARARVQRRIKSPKNKNKTADGDDIMEEDTIEEKVVADTVASKSRAVADDLQSSASVVSDGSIEASNDRESQETKQKQRERPPVKDVQVYTKQHPGQEVHRRRSQQEQYPERTSSNSLMATMRSSIETFDGYAQISPIPSRVHHHSVNVANANVYHPMHMDVSPCVGSTTMMTTMADLEPLSLKESVGVKVNFHDSSSTMQSEQSFEDAMSDFAQEMEVPV